MAAVLIVGDDAAMRDALAEAVRDLGHDARLATSGETALEMLSREAVSAGGSILGGYFTGYSRYPCPFMPQDLAFNVPRNNIANAQALFRRMAGPVTILESASRIHAKARNIRFRSLCGSSAQSSQ